MAGTHAGLRGRRLGTPLNLSPRSATTSRSLTAQVHDKPLVYLDNAATSQKPRQVIQALVDYYEQYERQHPPRASTPWPKRRPRRTRAPAAKAARFIGADSPDEILFTRNTTESLNLVAYTWAAENIRAGDEIVITTMEHHSNIVPWQCWRRASRARSSSTSRFGEDGTIDLSRRRAARDAAHEAGLDDAHVERAWHDQPGPRGRARSPTAAAR